MYIPVTAPLTREQARNLKAGDSVLISGVIYTARDAAHKRLCELVDAGKEMPLDVKETSSILWAPPRPSPDRPSALPVPLLPIAWMPIPPP